MRKKPLEDTKTKCPVCSKEMKETYKKISGIKVRAWECFSCKQILLHPEDAKKAEDATARGKLLKS